MAFIGIHGFGLDVSLPRLRLPRLVQMRHWMQDREEARHLRHAVERLDAISPHLLEDAGIEFDKVPVRGGPVRGGPARD